MGFTASNRLARRMHMQNCNLDGATQSIATNSTMTSTLCKMCSKMAKWRETAWDAYRIEIRS